MQSSFVSFGQCSLMTGPPAERNFSTVAAALAVGFCISSSSSSPLSPQLSESALTPRCCPATLCFRATRATPTMLLLCWMRVPQYTCL